MMNIAYRIDAFLLHIAEYFGISYAITERSMWLPAGRGKFLHICRADEGRGVWLAVGSRMLLVSHERA